jgi:hypothetical protein
MACQEIRQRRREVIDREGRKSMYAQLPARCGARGGNLGFRRLDGAQHVA